MNRTHYLLYASMILACSTSLHGVDELEKAQELAQKSYEEIKQKLTRQIAYKDPRISGITAVSSGAALIGIYKLINGKPIRGTALTGVGIFGIFAVHELVRRYDQRR